MIYLTNSLTKKKELFTSISPGRIGLYSCGPTVYDYVHIGNLRSFLLSDLVRRVFEYNGFEVRQIMNITDIGHLASDNDEGEDKMTRGLLRDGMPVTLEAMLELGGFYAEKFKENLAALNILMPHELPRASGHITEDIKLIQKLEKKGFTYQISDGLYFDTSKDPHYGKLGGTGGDESRIGFKSDKKNPKDFALWKFNHELGYESPWGKGFPGWHIECSAMSERYLGEHFDIHTGGADLASIHHNNEIAQSECAHSHQFVNYWLHNAFINVESGKMAKSEGTGITLGNIIERGINPLAYRYWLLGGHYRTPMTFSWEALDAAAQAHKRLQGFIQEWNRSDGPNAGLKPYEALFLEAINDDLNTPKALAVLWDMVADGGVAPAIKKATLLKFDTVLGLKLGEKHNVIVPNEVKTLVEERELARKEKRWNDADILRKKIQQLGFEVKDMVTGSNIEKM